VRRLRDPQGVAAWLITTAKRESWSVARKRRREPANTDATDALAADAVGNQDVQMAEVRWSDELRVHEALAQVGERCQQLLWLLYFDPQEPPYDEISARLGMPEGSIGPTRSRCLEKMRRILGRVRLGGL
jgi:RNA polymerase sigma factor (sigma-70 family)